MTNKRIKNCLSDAELVHHFVENGDERAFDVLFKRHGKRMFNHILFTVKDEDVANDLFQDALLKVIMMLREHRYVEEGKFQGWLMRVTSNMIMDYYRRKPSTIDRTISTDDVDIDILNRQEFSEAPVEDVIVRNQVMEDALNLMNALPETQREIVELRFFRDLSFKEIAEKKGMSINTALGRMHYAVNNMRKLAKKHSVALAV